MIRLLLPLAGVSVFFLSSLATVRLLRPKQPRAYFLAYALLLLPVSAAVYLRAWGLATLDDALGLAACLLLQALLFLTVWNSFYSLLWGFSGGLMYDLLIDPSVRHVERLIRVYEGGAKMDRILARRVPNIATGGYIDFQNDILRLRRKGQVIALGTRCSFKLFSLGMGGGIK